MMASSQAGETTRRHEAHLILGSNIEPEANIRRALQLLGERVEIGAVSSVWETQSVGYDGPNFLNLAVQVHTALDAERLKHDVLREIEMRLGRVRVANKNAPRTIDLDILLHDGQVVDEAIWRQAYLAVPLAELLPGLTNERGERLELVAQALSRTAYVMLRARNPLG